LLREQCSKPDVSASAFVSLGTLCAKQGRYDAAIEYYRRALALDYGQVHWRLELAGLLAKAGSAAEALHEAQVCLRLRPQMDAANKLVGELSVNRSVIAEEVNRH
jgi:tetratricopeptide (TPR) repeat protein